MQVYSRDEKTESTIEISGFEIPHNLWTIKRLKLIPLEQRGNSLSTEFSLYYIGYI